MSPRFISGCPKRALSLATIKSHASANSRPPPRAKPLTAAMTGIGRSSKLSITRWPRRVKSRPSTADIFAIAAISAPATKALSPAPVIISTRTDASWRTSRITRAISSSTSRFNALSAAGRLTVSVAIAAFSKIIFLRSMFLIPPCTLSMSTPRAAHSALAQKSPCANNLTVPYNSRAHAAGFLALAVVIVIGAARISWAQESAPSHKPARAIFVANPTANSLSVFPVGSNGNVPSLFTRTFLGQPSGIAYWKGNLYVTNTGGPGGYSVTAYPVSGGRRPAPLFTISGRQLIIPQGVALDSAGNIYVVNGGIESGDQSSDPPSVTIYRAGSKKHDAPMARIRGPKTGLKNSQAIALDSHGYIYVSNQGENGEPDSITVYSPGSKGNVAPARIISGSATLLSAPEGVAVDSNGRLFVSSGAAGPPQSSNAAVLVFAPGSNGNVAPFASIDCNCAKLRTPGAITLDSNGNVYVTTRNLDTGTAGVAVYTENDQRTSNPLNLDSILAHHPTGPPTTEGGYQGQCLTPILSIAGDQTRIADPGGIAVDPDGNMYVTNSDSSSDSIGVFKADADGNVAPSYTIESPTQVSSPSSVAIGPDGKIYVANGGGQEVPPEGSNAITVYPPGSYANVAEIATISSGEVSADKTGISFP